MLREGLSLVFAAMVTSTLLADPRILVVTATEGFRHDSIETAERVLAGIAAARGVEVEYARTAEELRAQIGFHGLQAVFLVNTTGELPHDARESLLAWVTRGGTLVGIHSASDTWHSSPEYVEMLGAEFVSHPPDYDATVVVADPLHPATRALPSPHVLLEEIYAFANFDPARVSRVLLTVDGVPMAWEKRHGNGEVLYTALGHRIDVWESAWFQAHVGGIVEWMLDQRRAPSRRRVIRR